jgi:hypothetical protein
MKEWESLTERIVFWIDIHVGFTDSFFKERRSIYSRIKMNEKSKWIH